MTSSWFSYPHIISGLNYIIWCLAVGLNNIEEVEVRYLVIRSTLLAFVRQDCRSHQETESGKQLCAAGELFRVW